jgi:LCP family protein required for cell wall assembly
MAPFAYITPWGICVHGPTRTNNTADEEKRMSSEGASVRRASLRWTRLVCAILFVAMVGGGLYLGYVAYVKFHELAAHTQFRTIPILPAMRSQSQPQQQGEQPAASTDPNPAQKPEAPVQVAPQEIYPDIENKERVNILFLGIDQRPGESTACRTDTMILISINPKDMSASLLSIPRDLWVPIRHPKHTEDRINTAHYWGEVENYPGGGPELAKDTVQYNLGVPVHYYVRLNFTGFEQIIDRIGGIDIDVPVTIHDEKYPGPDNTYETLHIDAGHHHFDGKMALKYARTRQGGGDGDFSRMQRQQQVILAIRDRVLHLPNLPQLIVQIPQLYRDMGSSLSTDIAPDMMLTLAKWGQQIDVEKIKADTIDRRMTRDMRTADDRAVLLYDREKARPIIEALFGDPTPEAIASVDNDIARLEAEGAHVAVYNGTTQTGLAQRVAEILSIQGIDIVQVDNADRFDYAHTVVNVYHAKPDTAAWLTQWLTGIGIPEPQVNAEPDSPAAQQAEVDVAIIIGQDLPADTIK